MPYVSLIGTARAAVPGRGTAMRVWPAGGPAVAGHRRTPKPPKRTAGRICGCAVPVYGSCGAQLNRFVSGTPTEPTEADNGRRSYSAGAHSSWFRSPARSRSSSASVPPTPAHAQGPHPGTRRTLCATPDRSPAGSGAGVCPRSVSGPPRLTPPEERTRSGTASAASSRTGRAGSTRSSRSATATSTRPGGRASDARMTAVTSCSTFKFALRRTSGNGAEVFATRPRVRRA